MPFLAEPHVLHSDPHMAIKDAIIASDAISSGKLISFGQPLLEIL